MAHVQGRYVKLWKPQDLNLDKISSQKIFVENPDAIEAFAESMLKRVAMPVTSIAELRAINTSDTSIYTDSTIVSVKSSGIYYFDRMRTDADNGTTIIAPTTGGGRWISGIDKATQNELNKLLFFIDPGDSKELKSYTYARLTGYQLLNNVDLNNIKQSGQYGVMHSCTNKPSDQSYGMMEVLIYSLDWLIQRYYAIDNLGSISGIWYRTCFNINNWTEWTKYRMDKDIATLVNAEVM